MLSLPIQVEEDFKSFLEISLPTYEVKPYKLEVVLQPSLNVKQVVKIGQDLMLQKFIVEAKYIQEP